MKCSAFAWRGMHPLLILLDTMCIKNLGWLFHEGLCACRPVCICCKAVWALSYSDMHLCALFEQEEKEMLVAGKVAQGGAVMEDDQMSQVSELTGFNIGALAGSGLFAQGLTNSACFGSDDENANGSCGGGNASIAMSASYASSQTSEAAKSRPTTPEPGEHASQHPTLTCLLFESTWGTSLCAVCQGWKVCSLFYEGRCVVGSQIYAIRYHESGGSMLFANFIVLGRGFFCVFSLFVHLDLRIGVAA